MPRENDRRDKALEDIARELGKTNKLLEKIEHHNRPVIVNSSLVGVVRPDAFDVPQQPQPGKDETKPAPVPFPKSDHPYFKQRTPDDIPQPRSGDNYEGPYGYGNGQPYS